MPNIRHLVLIGAPSETVYDAVSSQEGLSAWWTPDVEAKPELNSVARFAFGPDYFKEMRIIELEPPRRVKWNCIAGVDEWVGTTISFDLQSGDQGSLLQAHPEAEDQLKQLKSDTQTLLSFSQDDWREYTPMLAECNYTWGRFLRGLKLFCETGQGQPWPNQHRTGNYILDETRGPARLASSTGAISVFDLTNPIYHDANAARDHLETLHWPNCPVCPHCGERKRVTRLTAATARAGLHKCNECRKQFTVTVGTIFEDSKIPLNKWLLGFRLMSGSKKGISAHQLHRSLGITYKSAWFLAHRIREAMDMDDGPLGGPNAVVEADETYVGGKARNRATRAPAPKKAVVALVDRDGNARSFHVANVNAKTLRPLIVTNVDRASHLMTDESMVYTRLGREFAGHTSVVHSAGEYVRMGGFAHSNTAENFFSIFKRGLIGTYHHMSEAHLGRYCREFDFRYNTRTIGDAERTDVAIVGARGKRLTYRRTDRLAA